MEGTVNVPFFASDIPYGFLSVIKGGCQILKSESSVSALIDCLKQCRSL